MIGLRSLIAWWMGGAGKSGEPQHEATLNVILSPVGVSSSVRAATTCNSSTSVSARSAASGLAAIKGSSATLAGCTSSGTAITETILYANISVTIRKVVETEIRKGVFTRIGKKTATIRRKST